MRDITQLHPELQIKINELLSLCKKKGITIGIGECVRTVAEQDALYAKGRTAPGSKVTNARGSSYSSMHQWGVAFDFYLKMDVDKDGSISDDAFNNTTRIFNTVGKLGRSIGLEWGGDWTSIKDLPHFQLKDWGSTTSKLKSIYGTPEKFKNTWKNTSSKTTSEKTTTSTKKTNTPASKSKDVVDSAQSKNKTFSGDYTLAANVNLRTGASTSKDIVTTIPKRKTITCHGYYTKNKKGETWYFVEYGKYTGFIRSDLCKKKK